MLYTFALLIFVSSITLTTAQEVDDVDGIQWQKPLQPISASDADETLVLLLITNDEPVSIGDVDDPPDVIEPDDPQNPSRLADSTAVAGWCTDVFAESYRAVRRSRRDLRDRFSLQWLPAGLPRELTGGKPDNVPARAMLLVCDGHYRLLSFLVGVPDAEDLQTLIEDAQEYQSLRDLENENSQPIVVQLAQRSSQRVTRIWRGVLEETVMAMEDNLTDDPAERIQFLNDRYAAIYANDVRLRFGLNDVSDRDRLTVLEQHVPTRKPWSESMIPFLAGADAEAAWATLVETVWGHPPIRADIDVTDLAEEIQSNPNQETFVLSIQPPLALNRFAWPPESDATLPSIGVWQKVHAIAKELNFHDVDLQQLSDVMKATQRVPIDVRGTSLIRYVVFPPHQKKPLLVFQGDPPGRALGMMKRFQSKSSK